MSKSTYGRNPRVSSRFIEEEIDETSDDDNDGADDEIDENETDEDGNVWKRAPNNVLKNTTDDDDDDESDDEGAEPSESEAEEKDLLLMNENDKDRTQLPEGKAVATVTGVAATRVASKFDDGTYVRVEITLNVKNNESGEVFAKKFFAAKDSDRLFDLVSGILGFEPEEGFNLKSLINKKTIVVIEHRENAKGELWDEIVSAKPYEKSSAKKNYR